MISRSTPPPTTTRPLRAAWAQTLSERARSGAGAAARWSGSGWATTVISLALLCDVDPRVDPRVRDVDQQVEAQQEQRVDHHASEDQRLVAVQHAVDEVLPEAGDVEHLLDDERARQRVRGRGTEVREHGQERVAQAVLPDHQPAAEALGASGADEVGA